MARHVRRLCVRASGMCLSCVHVSVTCHNRGVVTRQGMEDGTSRPSPVCTCKWNVSVMCTCVCDLPQQRSGDPTRDGGWHVTSVACVYVQMECEGMCTCVCDLPQ